MVWVTELCSDSYNVINEKHRPFPSLICAWHNCQVIHTMRYQIGSFDWFICYNLMCIRAYLTKFHARTSPVLSHDATLLSRLCAQINAHFGGCIYWLEVSLSNNHVTFPGYDVSLWIFRVHCFTIKPHNLRARWSIRFELHPCRNLQQSMTKGEERRG